MTARGRPPSPDGSGSVWAAVRCRSWSWWSVLVSSPVCRLKDALSCLSLLRHPPHRAVVLSSLWCPKSSAVDFGTPADPAGASPGRGRVVRWRAGDAVEAWMGEMVRHRGVVEEAALQLGVVWIREQGTGMRILIDLNEAGTELRHPEPPPVRR